MRCLFVYLLLALSCALLQGCGSSGPSSSNSSPVSDPKLSQQITILSPADGSLITTVPATVKVQLTNVDPNSMKVLLDGIDITSSFGMADGNGIRTASVTTPALNLGKNQLQVSASSVQAAGFFLVDLNSGSSSGPGLPLLVPIKTRVLCKDCDGSRETDYNVTIYADPSDPAKATNIQAPPLPKGSTPNQGFQIVLLRRSDLTVVSNTSVANPTPTIDNTWIGGGLGKVLTSNPPSACGNPSPGCLLVVQSLGTIGYAPCATLNFPRDCGFGSVFMEIVGGSGRWAYANGSNPQIAYSFIGNFSSGPLGAPSAVPAGTYYERLTCSGNNNGTGTPCDSLGYPSTTQTAPNDATPDQIGNMAGALVRDNYFNFTYVQNAPILAFSSQYDSTNISHAFTINGNTIWSGFAKGSGATGGIHVVVVDHTNPNIVIQNQWYPSNLCADELGAPNLDTGAYSLIGQYNTHAYLVFVAAFGDTTYEPEVGECSYNNHLHANNGRSNWTNFASLMNLMGGTWQVWFLTNYPNQEYPPAVQFASFKDDYTLVGAFKDTKYSGLQNKIGAEMSSVISRETELNPLSSEMEGVLMMDHQGYYSPKQVTHNLGFFNDNITAISAASRLNPTPWPFPGSSLAVSQATYKYISQQLCCDDIRAAYVNQNVSPEIWYQQLQLLPYPDVNPAPAFTHEDFVAMQQQLGKEFQYLSSVRRFQDNLFQLFQDRQAAVPLLLQQAQNRVTQDLQVDLNTMVSVPKWESITDSVLGVLGGVSTIAAFTGDPILATALKTGIACAQLGITIYADETNTPAGTSLKAQENLEVQAGRVAASVVTSYNSSLAQAANQFDRIASDWGRLKTLGGPLIAGQIPWDNSAAFPLLQVYDRAIRREFYTSLLQANTQISQYQPVAVGPFNNNTDFNHTPNQKLCHYDRSTINPYYKLVYGQNGDPTQEVPVLFYPSGQANSYGSDSTNGTQYPYDFLWSAWALLFTKNNSDTCPFSDTLPGTFGLFDPLDPDNPQSLGAYRLWWFTRNPNFTVNVPPDFTNGGYWGSCDLGSSQCGTASN